jgi:preprotein translocase subunit SecG
MATIVLVIHLLIALALVGVVLLQRSEGGGLGIGGGTMGGFMTARGSANLLTRTTAFLAAAFFVTSLVLAILAGTTGGKTRSILDQMPSSSGSAPAPDAAPAGSGAPAAPAVPAPPTDEK